ncbi:hypothetical protein BKN14_03820 [Candidatus Gracilibacteria bacterium HOT-871]|nr:hypothetical protein BKN14_03820 [Candidatus Gracilibacteria bacterium HOT-871]MBF0913377.1 NUDIX domain-containing protein [Candidatus Gracilibacteria bacterium]
MNYPYKKYILETLEKYKKYFKSEEKRFELLEKQLENNENLWTRKNFNGHLTASAYIFDKSMQNFVVIHNINLDKWLVPGGHWEEGDGEMQNTAKREAMEETGLSQLKLCSWHNQNEMIPIDIDTHYIPENKKKDERQHFHHDFRYIFIYDGDFSEINIETQEIKGFQILNINDDLTKLAGNDVILKIKNISKKNSF